MKMRNYVFGSIEVQNADVSSGDEKVGSLHGNSRIILTLLSDDDTAYMPYRVENFSKEVSILFHYSITNLSYIVGSLR